MQTLLLNPPTWDLLVDGSGDIAVAGDPYSQAQDAASAIKLFQGELLYDTTRGVPYWASILGQAPPMSLMKAKWVAAALTVPGTITAVCYIGSFVNRIVTGQVQISNDAGKTAVAGFGTGRVPITPSFVSGPPPSAPTDESPPIIAIA